MMKEEMMPSIEDSSTETTEKEVETLEITELGDDLLEGVEENSEEDLEAKKLLAAHELGIEASDLSEEELSKKIVEKLEKDEDPKGFLSKMPGVRAFVKAAILTVGLGIAGGGLANKSFAAESPEGGQPDSSLVDENQEKRAHEIRAYQSIVNDFMEKLSINFGDKISDEQLNNFQNKGWEWAGYVVDNGGTEKDFKLGLYRIYSEDFSEQIKERATQLAQELAPESIDKENVDDAWLADNVDKVFHNGTDIYVVKKSSSRDMQLAINKARLDGEEYLHTISNKSGYGEKERTSINKIEHGYEAIVLVKLSLE